MKDIIILDSICVNSGDLSWDRFERLLPCKIYERTSYDEIIERAKNAEIILTNKCSIDKNVIDNLPNLKYIGELATGYNNIDVTYAKEKGIVVTNVPAYSTDSVAQCIFALMLELATDVGYHNQSVKNGDWERCKDFCYYKKDMIELSGKTLGIIGYGQIGKKLKLIANAFSMQVIVYNKGKMFSEESNFKSVNTLEELLQHSDFVSLNCPLNEGNAKMINKDTLKYMKPSAFLINTARGGLIDEKDLSEALNIGKIRGAGLDVLSIEPAQSNNPVLKAKNVIITPHIAWATKEARGRLIEIAFENLKSFLETGIAQNIVNN